MSIKDKLQINIITYNRKNKLKKTLDFLLDENSPIKDIDITILNNASTDGTSELIDNYCLNYKNLKHITNIRNIGGNANICRAFEIAKKDYVWVLCDDDEFDFSNWDEVKSAILSEQYDMIFTINHLSNFDTPDEIPALLFLASFVPGVIYKTKFITADILVNMYGCISTWFPQAIPAIDILVNNKGKYFLPSKNIVLRVTVDDLKGEVFHRGQDEKKEHPDLSRMYWHVGYMKVLKFVQDKKIRQQLCLTVTFNELFYQTGTKYLKYVIDHNARYKDDNIDNYWDIFSCISPRYKIFMLYYLFLGRYKILQKIFSLTNSSDKSHKILIILGIKIKLKRFGK